MIPFDDPLYPSAPTSEALVAEEFAAHEQLAAEHHPEPVPDADSEADSAASAQVVSELEDPANEAILDDLKPKKAE